MPNHMAHSSLLRCLEIFSRVLILFFNRLEFADKSLQNKGRLF
jgi:hypothetical protein